MTDATPRKYDSRPDPAYWEALGRFIECHARVELVLILFLSEMTGTRHVMARAVFSSMRSDAAITAIRHALEVAPRSPDQMSEIDDVLRQMKEISNARNDVVHQPSLLTSDKGRIVTNAARTHLQNRIRERRVSPQLLDAMTADLEKISLHLITIIVSPPSQSLADRALEAPGLLGPWGYKQPQELLRKENERNLKHRPKA